MTTRQALVLLAALLGPLPLRAAAETPAPPDKPAHADAFGDPLPDGVLARLGTLRFRHGGAVLFLAYIDEGKSLITASQDGTVRMWEADSGKEIRRYASPQFAPNMISCAALSPDGERIAVGGQDGAISFYEIASGRHIRQVKGNPANGIAAVLFTADGKSVFAKSYDQAIRHWDIAEGKELRKFGENNNGNQRIFYNGGPTSTMALINESKTLASGAMVFDNNQISAVVKFYDVTSGKELSSFKGPVNGVQSLAFAPDGKTLAWGTPNNGAIGVWDVATQKEVRQLSPGQAGPFYPNAVAFSPDGKRLAARNYDHSMRIWDLAEGKEIKFIPSQSNSYTGSQCNLAFTPDGKHLASGLGMNTLGQWDLTTGQPVGFQAGHSGGVHVLALAADGKTAATRGYDNTVRLWDTGTGKEISSFALPLVTTHVAFSGDGQTVVHAGYDGNLFIRDVKTGKELRQWRAHAQQNPGFLNLDVSRDGKMVATRGYELVTRLWDTGTGQEVRQLVEPPVIVNGQPAFGYYGNAVPMIFSHDGSTLVVVSGSGYSNGEGLRRAAYRQNNLIRLWDAATGKQLRQFDMGGVGVAAVALAPDGRTLVSSNYNGTLSLWEAASGKERYQIKPSIPGTATVVAFSADGKRVAGTWLQGTTPIVRLLDAASGKELGGPLKGHQSVVLSLAFAADGRKLVSGSQDSTALVWDVASIEAERRPATALDEKQAESLWTELANADAKKAYEALRILAVGGDTVSELLREHLHPVEAPDPQRVNQLLLDLESNVFAVRRRATAELEKLGELAEPDLHKLLQSGPTLEIRQRVERLLDRLVTGEAPPSEELRVLRAFEVLEHLATPDAREVLQRMAGGAPGARLTRQAQATLERLAKQ
jgi:WD40 repeat protein